MRRLACLASLLLTLAGPAGAQEIGSVAAVNAQVTGTPPQAATRVLEITDPVIQNELIASSDVGSAQLLFLDQTSLTVSPQSEVVLDHYVYDPERAWGEITVGMMKGVLRFVGGRITKQTEAVIQTPVATIGIRGGIALLSVSDELVRVVHAAGDYTRASCPGMGGAGCQGPAVTVSRPNAVIEIRPGSAPRYVGTASSGDVGDLLSALSGTGGAGARTLERIVTALDRGQGGTPAAVPTGGDAPHLMPISTTGESGVNMGPLDLALDSPAGDIDFRTLAFSDSRFLHDLGQPGGGFVDVGRQGEVRGQLVWANNADLDLHLFLPDNAGRVFYGNDTVVFNGGLATAELDADNLGGVVNVPPDLRVENIVVDGQVPHGTYEFLVNNFSANGNQSTDFSLSLTPNGGSTVQVITGTLGPEESSDRIPLLVGPGS